jgi:cytochrome c oxidase assembly protein subunit 11
MGGLAYASVPLYRMFCAATGFGGTVRTSKDHNIRPLSDLEPVDLDITIEFNADVNAGVPWRMWPAQRAMNVRPGEPALAFYTAVNDSDEPLIGVASYNVTPMKAGPHFAKIQCFCFEDQRLEPHEEVDLPVLFYIDPEIVKDPDMKGVKNITLSYTFFKSA